MLIQTKLIEKALINFNDEIKYYLSKIKNTIEVIYIIIKVNIYCCIDKIHFVIFVR